MRATIVWLVVAASAASVGTLQGCRDEDDAPVVPRLASITAAEAARLGAHARRLRCSSQGSATAPVAWSAINTSCQDRAWTLELAIAGAGADLAADPPTLVDTDLTLTRLEELAANPTYDAATINVAGPLVTFQTLIDPQGSPIGQDPLWFFWAYHHGVVLNVDGELRVLDLSVGDAPIPIDVWLASFTDPSVRCKHLSDSRHAEVWVYWNASFNNFEPPSPPPELCSYTITPIFTNRRDQTLADMRDAISFAPGTMNVQLGTFRETVSHEYGVSLAEVDAPLVTSKYRAGTVADVCARNRMRFCDDL